VPVTNRVVLLHSALGDSRLWRRQVAALDPRFEVVTPDLPGFGSEPVPTEPFSFVERTAALLPGSLVGNSLGGGIALRTALVHPELVERLVLVGSGMPDWEWSAELEAYFEREEEAITRGDLDAATDVNVEFWVAPEHRDEVRPQLHRAIELQTAPDAAEPIWPDLPPLESLATPTLVVVGDRDKDDFRRIAETIAAAAQNARLEVVSGAGHLVGLDRPDELNRLLLEFLEDGVG
jgi:3-oxoadipate enol-lactonase